MAGWHHRLDAHESEWIPGVGDGQGGLMCCDSWGCKESDTTEWLNWIEKKIRLPVYYLTQNVCASFESWVLLFHFNVIYLLFCFQIQAAAREEILANGGSLSHHHGGILFWGVEFLIFYCLKYLVWWNAGSMRNLITLEISSWKFLCLSLRSPVLW